jgi:hypothetical protein
MTEMDDDELWALEQEILAHESLPERLRLLAEEHKYTANSYLIMEALAEIMAMRDFAKRMRPKIQLELYGDDNASSSQA